MLLSDVKHMVFLRSALQGKSENATASDPVYSNTLMKDVQINNSERSWRTRLISSIKERGWTKEELEAIRLFKTNLWSSHFRGQGWN